MERPKNASARRRWQWVQTLLNHWSSGCWHGGWVAVPVQDWMTGWYVFFCFLKPTALMVELGQLGSETLLYYTQMFWPDTHNAQALSLCSVRVRMMKLSGSVMYPWCRAQANSLFPMQNHQNMNSYCLRPNSQCVVVYSCLFSNDLGLTSADWFLITWLTARLRQRLMMNCRRWKKWSRKLFTMKL